MDIDLQSCIFFGANGDLIGSHDKRIRHRQHLNRSHESSNLDRIRMASEMWEPYAFGRFSEPPYHICGSLINLFIEVVVTFFPNHEIVYEKSDPPKERALDADYWPYEMLANDSLDVYLYPSNGKEYGDDLEPLIVRTWHTAIIYDGAIMSRRLPRGLDAFSMVYSLDLTIWMGIMCSFLAVYAFSRGLLPLTLGDHVSILDLIGTGLRQNMNHSRFRWIATQLILAIWLWFVFIMDNIWTSDLLSFLMLLPPDIKVESLQDLSHRTDLIPFAFRYENSWKYIRSRVDELARSIHDRLQDIDVSITAFEDYFEELLERAARVRK
jgi:hypothetical protein